jgi:tryptophanyl-tRNA synthetase
MSVEEVTGGVADIEVAAAGGAQVVTPWDVEGGADGKIDYAKLVNEFGCSVIDEALVQRIERVTVGAT